MALRKLNARPRPRERQCSAGFWSDFRVGAQAARGADEPLLEVEGLAGEQLADVTFRERSVVARLIADFDVRPPRPQALFGTLSGGNQQKALLAKWLHLRPAVLVLDDPTSGVDPGARQTIFEFLRDAASEGLRILFFSTEPEQLASMCSRVLILKDGVIAGSLTGAELSHQAISRWCYA